MAVLGSIFFKRTLKQFLDCDDLESPAGVALIEKLRKSAPESLQTLIETIPETDGLHAAMLTEICMEQVGGGTEDLFFRELESDATEIRRATASILSRSTQINPARLLKKLHEENAPVVEIITILEFQAAQLKPEQIISHALRLGKSHAEQLLKLASKSELPVDLDVLHIEPGSIPSPTLKIALLRYFAEVEQPRVAQFIGRFLDDSNTTVVIEALKALKNLKVDFDASVILPSFEAMSDVPRGLALEILEAQADSKMVPKVAPLVCGKPDETSDFLIRLFVRHVTPEGLEEFLTLLDDKDWWGKEQALKNLQSLGNDGLFMAAAELTESSNDFVREQAQALAALASDPADIEKLWANALHEDWQVRENAIDAIGRSGKRESIATLKEVIEKRPESATAVLRAASELGFSKGLEIAFACLRMPEALVQREALRSIGKLTKPRHAKTARDKLMKMVPSLQATVRDTAGEVVSRMTKEFDLQPLDVDQETFFDTRLMKFDETVSFEEKEGRTGDVVQVSQNIEDFKEGDRWLERFVIDREIGRGAMGRVMLASDEMVGEPLILKFMHPELTAEEASRERFLREVRYSRKVSHPNVIRVHDMLFNEGLSAISMEYFESRGIDEFIKEKKFFEVDEGLKVLYQVANGMGAAHDQEVIHRDLKPSNILMNAKGLVKIVDFGIAAVSSQGDSDATLTQVGSIIGTPAYISPERAKGLEADHRADIYALGVIAYCMLVGKLPYVGEPMSLLFQHIEGNAKPLHEVREDINPRVSLLVQKMMAVDLDDRLQTMTEVAEAIKDVQQKLA